MLSQLDIGCSGFVRQAPDMDECFGVDIVPHPTEPHIRQADLAIEPIPFESDRFGLVTAHDFLEHIPAIVYLPIYRSNRFINIQRHCLVELFNEIYRVLKPGGTFYASSPCYPDRSVFQDPTHMSFWTEETPHYFSGDYYSFHDHYGHTSRFELVERRVDNGHIQFRLQARKDVPEGTEYQLRY